MRTVAEVNELAERLAELVKQVQAGGEVGLTQDHKLVARLVPASQNEADPDTTLRIRSLKGHQVLSPVVSQVELAEELFAS
jgi:antitoxin (DNA-binding transcriptional repressor) of toxin-antitoxin stability system